MKKEKRHVPHLHRELCRISAWWWVDKPNCRMHGNSKSGDERLV
jgi:hypothetical protein